MRILHYALGFPPYRSGGLTKYCMDLMTVQIEMGHDVAMMWPGRFSLSGHSVRLKRGKKIYKIRENGAELHNKSKEKTYQIGSIEVVNPLPVSLDEGIVDVDTYTAKCKNPQAYKEFLEEYKPDAIHIHTLMGIHKEFVKIAKELDIRIVFTSHDYFGICPKVTLFREGKVCDGDCRKCGECNLGALSLNKIKILQSGIYRTLKDTAIVKKLRASHRQEFFDKEALEKEHNSQSSSPVNIAFGEKLLDEYEARYKKLRKYYVNLLKYVDTIHFNSSVTESVYRKFIPEEIQGKVINITHSNIRDNRKIKDFPGEILKITYLAPAKNFKGFGIMKQALDELWIEGKKNFHLTMYNQAQLNVQYMTVNPSFEYSQLGAIFDETDVLIMPSLWYETFGFTVLEALSFGVPVIVTDNVGAKDLITDGVEGIITRPTVEGIKEAVSKLMDDRKLLEKYNRKIVDQWDMDKLINSPKEIEKLYKD